MRSFVCQNERSNKFWRIERSGASYTVYFGRIGTGGRSLTKWFRSAEECERQAERIIAQKLKKGYLEEISLFVSLEDDRRLYLGSAMEIGQEEAPHPQFKRHFRHTIYSDWNHAHSPFGSPEGAGTLRALEELYLRWGHGAVSDDFPQLLLERDWDLFYVPPLQVAESDVAKLLNGPRLDRQSNAELLLANDRVLIASALGQIKIEGVVRPALKRGALLALERMDALFRLSGDSNGLAERAQIARDLAAFHRLA
ncbi:WGR domain-containing protein [Paenibacillus sp. NPDC058071]|uniref:WGR domain-containing protein n=1 Tax=Paenibacillus sp. NPDC058071 TaxID=3346326 RepID=UPI0036DC657D